MFLDNDGEYIGLNSDLEYEDEENLSEEVYEKMNDFKINEYFGWTDGVFALFRYLGIKAESV